MQGKGTGAMFWGCHIWEWFIRLLDTPASPWFDLGHGERRDDFLRLAMRQAVDGLKQQWGSDRQKWAWGCLRQDSPGTLPAHTIKTEFSPGSREATIRCWLIEVRSKRT